MTHLRNFRSYGVLYLENLRPTFVSSFAFLFTSQFTFYKPFKLSKMVDILGLLFACLFLMATFGLSVLLLAMVRWRGQTGQGLVQVVVLGDAGRSPRMLYHCLSLVQLSYTIDLIGYGGIIIIINVYRTAGKFCL